MLKSQIIVGYGQIGSSVAKVFRIEEKYDPAKGYDKMAGTHFDVIHVAIPFIAKDEFIRELERIAAMFTPNLIIVHSTVAPNTCTAAMDFVAAPVVHMPIRGKHPNLARSIRVFKQFVGMPPFDWDKMPGYIGKANRDEIEQYIESYLDIEQLYYTTSRSTELGKLLDTTYYAMCLAFHQEAERLCKEHGAEFGVVMTEFNRSYNEGYRIMGNNNVQRPTLTPGFIGGHCLMPNIKILQDANINEYTHTFGEMLDWIEKSNEIKGKEIE